MAKKIIIDDRNEETVRVTLSIDGGHWIDLRLNGETVLSLDVEDGKVVVNEDELAQVLGIESAKGVDTK